MIKGQDLQNRAGVTTEPKDDDIGEKLRALRERIARVRELREPPGTMCIDCWRRGRDAALKIIDGV